MYATQKSNVRVVPRAEIASRPEWWFTARRYYYCISIVAKIVCSLVVLATGAFISVYWMPLLRTLDAVQHIQVNDYVSVRYSSTAVRSGDAQWSFSNNDSSQWVGRLVTTYPDGTVRVDGTLHAEGTLQGIVETSTSVVSITALPVCQSEAHADAMTDLASMYVSSTASAIVLSCASLLSTPLRGTTATIVVCECTAFAFGTEVYRRSSLRVVADIALTTSREVGWIPISRVLSVIASDGGGGGSGASSSSGSSSTELVILATNSSSGSGSPNVVALRVRINGTNTQLEAYATVVIPLRSASADGGVTGSLAFDSSTLSGTEASNTLYGVIAEAVGGLVTVVQLTWPREGGREPMAAHILGTIRADLSCTFRFSVRAAAVVLDALGGELWAVFQNERSVRCLQNCPASSSASDATMLPQFSLTVSMMKFSLAASMFSAVLPLSSNAITMQLLDSLTESSGPVVWALTASSSRSDRTTTSVALQLANASHDGAFALTWNGGFAIAGILMNVQTDAVDVAVAGKIPTSLLSPQYTLPTFAQGSGVRLCIGPLSTSLTTSQQFADSTGLGWSYGGPCFATWISIQHLYR